MGVKNKYRVIRYKTKMNKDYFAPQIQKRYLFWKRWELLGDYSFPSLSKAIDVIAQHKKIPKVKNPYEDVVWEENHLKP